jgi:hypothetical protein
MDKAVEDAREAAIDKGKHLRLMLVGFILVFLLLCVGAVAILWWMGMVEDVSHEFIILFYVTVLLTLLLSLLYFYLRMEIRATGASLMAKMDEVQGLLGQQSGKSSGSRKQGLLGTSGNDDYSKSGNDYYSRSASYRDRDRGNDRDRDRGNDHFRQGDDHANDSKFGTQGFTSGARSAFDAASDFMNKGNLTDSFSGARGDSHGGMSQQFQSSFDGMKGQFQDMAHSSWDQARSYGNEQATHAMDMGNQYVDKQSKRAEKEARRAARRGAEDVVSRAF